MRRRIKLWHIVVFVPTLCGLTGWIASEVIVRRARGESEQEIVRLRRLGMPTTPQEMERQVDPARNAAPLLRRAMVSLRALGEREPGTRGSSNPPVTYDKWVERQRPTLELLRQAAEKPDCDFKRDWSLGSSADFRNYSYMRTQGRLLAGASRLSARRGDFHEAMGWLAVASSLSRACQQESSLIGQLVSASNETAWMNQLGELIREHGTKPNFQESARALLTKLPPLPSIVEGMKGETLLLIQLFDEIDQGKVRPREIFSGDATKVYAMKLPWVRESLRARALTNVRTVVEKLVKVPDDPMAWSQPFRELEAELAKDDSIEGRMLEQIMPGFVGMGELIVRQSIRRDLTRIALALYAEKAATGAFPWSLPKAAPADPYTGRPFVYRPTGGSFELYSLGPNKVDDLGKPPAAVPSSTRSRTDDIAFGSPR